MNIAAAVINDRFTKRDGKVLITGVQALVRLMLLQAERDRQSGLRTAGFVSGYRGSPLGTLDTAFAKAGKMIADAGIVVQPAVNEELGATAIAGSQQIEHSPGAKVDGVFSLWYGKGPGLDRASDAVRHGNNQGASRQGGVVMAVGDDHVAKSSSIVCYSDEVIAGLQVPLFYPADPEEVVVYGLHAFQLSRLTGSWTALKILTEIADSTRAVSGEELSGTFVAPDIPAPPTGLHNRWPESPLEQELRIQEYRLPGALAYVRANALDRIVSKPAGARIGLLAAGKSWLDLLSACDRLGLSAARRDALGIALYKPALIWPLEPERLKSFTAGLDTIVVVEEKGPFVENQMKAALFGGPALKVYGKLGDDGAPLLSNVADLTPEHIAERIGALLARLTGAEDLARKAARAADDVRTLADFAVSPTLRKPFFCSGCPHNRSTVLPEGSRATAGIGCHGLAAYNREAHATFAQMGGEGIHWMGLSPFTDEQHIFANLGDGTYFHSGLLAIRQAIAAKLNITYKILYNDAVAMTGGQAVDGELTVLRLAEQLRAEGVGVVVIATDEPERYPSDHPVRSKVDRIEHRDDLSVLQRDMRDVAGVSVIIYEQTCATEKRRLRKRGKLPTPGKRVFINELVCEGCGDCSLVSNCLSVEPVDTAFGRKRRINQSSCNLDFSCLGGFCPSFVTVEGATLRTQEPTVGASPPPPARSASPGSADRNQRVVVGGIGGTGIVTVGALLSMAAHIEGLEVAVLDQVGMAQKGGAVTSHVHLGDARIDALRVPSNGADLVIACDQVVANARDIMAAIESGRTHVVANSDVAITGDFTSSGGPVPDPTLLTRRLKRRAGADRFMMHPFTRISEKLLGDAVGSNLMMLGAAYQQGWITFDLDAFRQAVMLNGVGVEMNLAAFDWGRQLAVDAASVYRAAGVADAPAENIDDLIARRADFLAAYQDVAYASRYRAAVVKLRDAEADISDRDDLARAAARSLFKLMAYKDEYEVARLYTDGAFARSLGEQFEGAPKLVFHMAPPILAGKDPATGHPRKKQFGGWMMPAMRLLARLRVLRGSRLDPFGYQAERRDERALIEEYFDLVEQLAATLTAANHDEAVAVAKLAMTVHGYGYIKSASIEAYRNALNRKLAEFKSATATAKVKVNAAA